MTKVTIEPIFPKKDLFDSKVYTRAIENAGRETAKAVEVDFKVTTRTWTHQPDFDIEHTPGKPIWVIATDDNIYAYVSEGTKPHIIRAKNAPMLVFFRTGFRPKSRVGWIGSNKGAKATRNLMKIKMVMHPGTQARNFAYTIKKKWDIEWPRQLARAIRASVAHP